MLIACLTRQDVRNLSQPRIDELRKQERSYYLGLVGSGTLRSYYLHDGARGNLLIFDVASVEEMHRYVMMSPMALYQKTTIYPLMAMQALRDLTSQMANR